MDTRTLGDTGLCVSRIGLGLAALGRPGYINVGHGTDLGVDVGLPTMEARTHAVLDAAWGAGVRYFDAARSYGEAEAFLRSWLNSRKIAPRSVTIGSKWGYTYTAGWQVQAERHEIKDHSLSTLVRQVAESHERLGDYLNLYQVHSATLESGILENRAVLAKLARFRDTGVKVGLSLTGPRQAEALRHAMKVVVGGERLFDCVQATWNLLEQSAGPALQEAKATGMGIIVKEALANGRLTERNTEAAFAAKRSQLMDIASHQEVRVDALALAVVLAQPWVDVVLSGATNVAQLLSNLSAQDVNVDLLDGEILPTLKEPPEEYWSTRSRLSWN